MQPDLTPFATLSLARLETHWHRPWLVAGFSHWGQGHAELGLGNQDAFASGQAHDHRGDAYTWLAVADGVSAAKRAAEGATFVTATVGHEIAGRLAGGQTVGEIGLTQAISATRTKLATHAKACKAPLTDFATTLLVAVLGPQSITVAKIGDGYVLGLERTRGAARLVPLAETQQPRSDASVTDLTHASWKASLRVRHIPDRAAAGIDTVALATDGCDRFFVKAGTDGACLNADLIDTHLTQSLAQLGARNLFVYLANLMGHRQFVDEGDDRTLLIATAPTRETQPCSPSTV